MTQRPSRPITGRVIATEAGVSLATVSKVLNRRPGVSAATRRRVEKVLERHRTQRVPGHRRSGLIIDLVVNEVDSQWSAEVITGVDEVLQQAGATMALSALHGDPARTAAWLERMAARPCDGVVLVVSEPTPRQHLILASRGVPVVLYDPVGGVEVGAPTVGTTNWAGAITATEHLIALGHRRIAHLAGPRGLMCSRARADGFRSAMARAGLPVPAPWLRFGSFDDPSGRAEMLALLDEGGRDGLPRPTAVFAASDRQALGVCAALHDRGLRVPQDVSVVGFDDLPIPLGSEPALTTVHQPVREMAALAARMVLRLVDGETIEPPRVELATRLIERSSTAPPAPAQRTPGDGAPERGPAGG